MSKTMYSWEGPPPEIGEDGRQSVRSPVTGKLAYLSRQPTIVGRKNEAGKWEFIDVCRASDEELGKFGIEKIHLGEAT